MHYNPLKLVIIVTIFLLSFTINAKTICTMTFNSADEKKVFEKNLTPMGYDQLELVPATKDPTWFKKACGTVNKCDILIISGHFGGLFFGEQSSTLSLTELMTAKEKNLCPSILDTPKAVYLMGCNTLSSKSPDHRSVNDYLRVLVGDGFPLNMAEEVAASRYLNFGQSMAEFMTSIFNQSQMIVGFESTGPLGASAAPRLEKAFQATTDADKRSTGISRDALLNAFKDTNLRAVTPQIKTEDNLKNEILFGDQDSAYKAWQVILAPKNISRHYDFIIKNQENAQLVKLVKNNPAIAQVLLDNMMSIFQQAKGLSQIQVKVVEFLVVHSLIDDYDYQTSLQEIATNILNKKLDYVSADQLCSILKEYSELDILSQLSAIQQRQVTRSPYGNYLLRCAGVVSTQKISTKVGQCLENKETYDWGCLTENEKELDINACVLAKSRNEDPENADDMMWFCYSKMKDNYQLNRANCLELTHQFSILGNQLRMNWNCLNSVTDF
jgi:hypothetical protein